MMEGFMARQEKIEKPESLEKPKISFDKIKKALLIAFIAISSMQETQAQAIHASYVPNEKSNIELNTIASEINSDAKSLETAVYNNADTFEIKIANYYETDKPDISPENAIKISETINKYLAKLNKDNIKEFLANDVVLRVSCDPRHTNFEGVDGKVGNLELAKARASTALSVIKDALSNFSNSEFSSEEINSIREKFEETKVEIPMTQTETGEGEDGVIDYHKVINIETNKPYTDSEWNELNKPENEQKLLEVYKEFRYATLVLETLDKHSVETVPSTDLNLKGYNKLYVLFDDSPSMKASKGYLAASLENNENDIPVDIVGFTSKVDTTFSTTNVKEAAKVLKDIKLIDDPDEWALDIVINKLQKIENNGEKELMVICTDEELQKVNKDKLETINKIATEKNIDIEFSIRMKEWNDKTHKEEERIYNIPLSKVSQQYQKMYDKSIDAKVKNLHRQIEINQKQIDEQYALLGKANNQKERREGIKNISSIKSEIQRLKEVLELTQTVSINDFK